MPKKTEKTKEIITNLKTEKNQNKNIKKTPKIKETKSTQKNKLTDKKSTTKANLNKKSKTINTTKTNKTQSPKKQAKKTKSPIVSVEYYDLPYRYNQTIVKVLAQTPNNLFIYWDISDEDKEKYKKEYGENFFETTKPILIIYNDTLHYSFEVEINDFANSWYLHVNDSKSDYRVELGRRPIEYNKKIENNYVYITTSNEIESPNDHILFDNSQHMVYFRNVKNNTETAKDVSNITFIKNMGKIYNIYDIYKKIYKDENIYDNSNPSSHMSLPQ